MREDATNRSSAALEVVLVIFALIVQQGAFISLPLILQGESVRGIENPYNTVGVAISLTFVVIVCLLYRQDILHVASRNALALLFMVLVVASTAWSIHPDITIRRGVGYVLTVFIAFYLSARMEIDKIMKLFSSAFAISAIGSLVFIAVMPQYGIMSEQDLVGTWRGVFPHKNVLGPVMSVAIFVELYLLVTGRGRPRWRYALLLAYLALVLFSRSATAVLLSIFYFAGTGAYLLWRRRRVAASVFVVNGVLLLLIAGILFWSDPTLILGSIGKDVTLTGRTTLWDVVVEFVRERPVVGWGYRAMWQLGDPTTTYADKLTGNWGVTSSHNAYLEITLQLGLIGLTVLVTFLGLSLWRSFRCAKYVQSPLGWFALMFFVGAIVSANTLETLAQNQVIDWVLFNVLSFACGLAVIGRRDVRIYGVQTFPDTLGARSRRAVA